MKPFFMLNSNNRSRVFRSSISEYGTRAFVILILLSVLLLPVSESVSAYTGVPTFSIITVVKDTSVTIRTYNFPAGEIFTVRMGAFGTLGIGGTVVGTTNSGAGGSFEETYTIPAGLVGTSMIAIRLDSPNAYNSYNWFYNSAGNVPITPSPGYTGVPTISIVSVVKDTSVTIKTNNFPANTDFTVRMGPFGTQGVGGTIVGTTPSGSGGTFQVTYNIPAALAGSSTIAIRLDSTTGFYYSYNWFYNDPSVSTPSPGYSGTPTFTILSAVTDTTVTIRTNNFPANTDFTVRMGAFGTKAVGGTIVATTPSGSGGTFDVTYNIPAGLAGSNKIAIRMDSASGIYYSYNWFYNNTAATPAPGYSGVPTISIVSAVKDVSVTIQTNNFPANQDFTVRMGAFGTKAIGGTVVATTPSGSGGTFQVTYNIPADLVGSSQIAIRLDSASGIHYSYNWFYNQ